LATVVGAESTPDNIQPPPPISQVSKVLKNHKKKRHGDANIKGGIRDTLLSLTRNKDDMSEAGLDRIDAALDNILQNTRSSKDFTDALELHPKGQEQKLSKRQLKKLRSKKTVAIKSPSENEGLHTALKNLFPHLESSSSTEIQPTIRKTTVKVAAAYTEKELKEIKATEKEKQRLEKTSIGDKTDRTLRHVSQSSVSGNKLKREF